MASTPICPLKETHGGKFSSSLLAAGAPNLTSALASPAAGMLAISQTPLTAQAKLDTNLPPHWPREGQRLPMVTQEIRTPTDLEDS